MIDTITVEVVNPSVTHVEIWGVATRIFGHAWNVQMFSDSQENAERLAAMKRGENKFLETRILRVTLPL